MFTKVKMVICYTLIMRILYCNYEILGNLIRYYREKNNISRNDFINLCENSFSLSTLRRAENGDYVSFDIYKTLCQKLGLIFSTNVEDYIKIDDFIKQTYSIINSGKQIVEYESLLKKIKEFNNLNINVVYLNELSALCIEVLNMYLKANLNNIKIISITEECFLNNGKMVGELARFLLNLYGLYYSRGCGNETKYLNYGKKLNESKLYFLDKIFYIAAITNKYELYRISKIYIESKIPKINENVTKFKKHFVKACIELKAKNYNKVIEEAKKALYICDAYKCIPERFELHMYETMGYAYINSNDFETTFNIYKEIYERNRNILEISYLLLFYSAEKTNNTYFTEKVIKEHSSETFGLVKNIFEYYNLKIKSSNKLMLQEYIINNFSLKKCKSFNCYTFFILELSNAIKETKCYKKFFDFIEENELSYEIDTVDFFNH